MEVSDSTTIYCDSLSSIQLANNLVFHIGTKHMEVHYHFVCERVFSGEVKQVYVPLLLDKLCLSCTLFSGALDLQHLDVPNLSG